MNSKTRYIIALVVGAFGAGMFIAGMICPPPGIIDSSIITAVGELFTFFSAVLGIDTWHTKVTRKKSGED